jgi:predicted alpha/beta superfamily hydrolase
MTTRPMLFLLYALLACAPADAATPAQGKLVIVDAIASPQLGNRRALRVYLPPSYATAPERRYPVLYMHDGQNLFDAKTAFIGVEWGVDETMDRLIADGAIEETIVVGIDNNADRIAEYTPCCDPKHGGGRIALYERFLIETVKPYVDATWRTRPGPADTGLMGSSLGGVASVHIALRHPEVFGKAAGMSSSFWWSGQRMIADVRALQDKPPVRLYIDAGTENDGVEDTRLMRAALLQRGYAEGRDFDYVEAQGAGHNEKWWAARLARPLTFLFPRKAD